MPQERNQENFVLITVKKDYHAKFRPYYITFSKSIKACSPCKLGGYSSIDLAGEKRNIADGICKSLCSSVEPNFECDFFGFNSQKSKSIPNTYLAMFCLEIVRKFK